MEEKEPFKIKFTTVLIVVLTLLAIIGILAFNLRRLEDQVKLSSAYRPEQLEKMVAGVPEINDYGYYSENYKNTLKKVLSLDENSTDSEAATELSIVKYPNGEALKGVTSVELDSLGDVYLNIAQSSPLYAKYGKTTKIASNVLDFEIVTGTGQDFWPILYLIHDDGTVSKLSGYTMNADRSISGDLKTEKVNGITDIVKIVIIPVDDCLSEAFVDINGNMFYVDGIAVE